MKKLLVLILMASLMITATACSGYSNNTADIATSSQLLEEITAANEEVDTDQQTADTVPAAIVAEYDAEDLQTNVDDAAATTVILQGDSIAVEGGGATVNGSILTITSAGTYRISGTLDDGQIIVDTQDAEAVVLVLNGVDVTSSISAAIYVASAEKTIINLADGSENYIEDGSAYQFTDGEDEPDAAIFSRDDLTINGSGALTIKANYKDGIASKDDLKIISGTITVEAVNDGIRGRDSVVVRDGVITVNAGADGIQSNNDESAEDGYIVIEGVTFNITSALDGIQAQTSLQVSGGDFTITTGGGCVNSSTSGGGMWGGRGMEGNPNKPAESAKGLKAAVDITITAGTFDINSADDSVHANHSITIDGGDFQIASGDDGIHADSTLVINAGEINITQSYEGIESARITLNGGTVRVNASDDAVNAAGGAYGSAVNGRPGQNEFTTDTSMYGLNINGGYLFVDAYGDGLDVNGTIEMTDGVVILNGPTNSGNGALDYLGSFNISGGFLVAVGSVGMAMAPSDTSTQYALMYNFDTVQAPGSLLHIETENGEEILTFSPRKEYQSVVLSSSALQDGASYLVFSGGSSSASASDGLYSGGIYTPGTQVAAFTISGMVTAAGAAGAFPRGPGAAASGTFPGGPGGAPGTHPRNRPTDEPPTIP